MKYALIAISLFISYNYAQYYIETKDNSLQGLFEYIKNKYWTKK